MNVTELLEKLDSSARIWDSEPGGGGVPKPPGCWSTDVTHLRHYDYNFKYVSN